MTPSQAGIRDIGQEPPNEQRRVRERGVWIRALLASVLAHGIIFLLLATSQHDPLEDQGAAGARERDEAPLDGSLRAVSLSEAPPRPTPPDGIPVPVPDLPEPPDLDPEPEVEPMEVADGLQGLLERPGELRGEPASGAEGRGQGDGGAGDEGLERTIPPSPRGLIVPPSNPNLDGVSVRVRVFVTAEGEVAPDSTLLVPPTRDESFNERLREEAASWRFEPARRAGEPVGRWFTYEVSM